MRGSVSSRKRSWLLLPIAVMMVLNLIPFFVMFVGSFKPSMALYRLPADLNPFTNTTTQNMTGMLKKVDMLRALRNSLLVSGSVSLMTLTVGMTGGYVFAKRSFRGKRPLFVLMLATMMLPRQVMMIPNFIVANKLGLVNSLVGVALTSVNGAYAIFLCRQYISGIPGELMDAARLDGCSEAAIFTRVVLPLSRPIMGALVIFTFIGSWNDFVWQNIMLTGRRNMTVPLALAYLEGQQTDVLNTLGIKMAGATVSAVPMLLIFFCFQRYFIRGIATGSLKE